MQEIGFIGLVLLKSSRDADENDRSDAKRTGWGWGCEENGVGAAQETKTKKHDLLWDGGVIVTNGSFVRSEGAAGSVLQ